MKRIVSIFIIISFMTFFTGCGNNKNINGKIYGTYGIINKSEMKNPNVDYRLIFGNIILGGLLIETIIAPIYFFGFSIYEPVGTKTTEKGVIN